MVRNGQLRIVFHQIVPPQSVEEKTEASLGESKSRKGST
jgi:hypothetical protein